MFPSPPDKTVKSSFLLTGSVSNFLRFSTSPGVTLEGLGQAHTEEETLLPGDWKTALFLYLLLLVTVAKGNLEKTSHCKQGM